MILPPWLTVGSRDTNVKLIARGDLHHEHMGSDFQSKPGKSRLLQWRAAASGSLGLAASYVVPNALGSDPGPRACLTAENQQKAERRSRVAHDVDSNLAIKP